ncbi:cytochrome c3 family protein [Roseicella aerolata]|uniref:Cytochrome c family protein n=1 Tax=Roseicella aerolata TaxID=2883479 RepID=A0A9X1IG29_9PROT|nr:cytochrome c3 family protein [Roseicella aerolata]MCB4823484.1 cytochrome c family protein [Roseicella aerolata]
MPQLFSPRADRRLRLAMGLGAAALVVLALAAWALARSDRAWGVGVAAPQPIPFSHAIHAGSLGLDCRYCHATVERAASAGMPTAETCLGCHRQVWSVSAQFAPLESALALGSAVPWSSVHRLPEHVRFHHGAHVAAGVQCSTCHGPVEAMPRTVKAETLSMGWCLDCHRAPEAAGIALPASPTAARHEHYGVEVSPLTRCSTCHR